MPRGNDMFLGGDGELPAERVLAAAVMPGESVMAITRKPLPVLSPSSCRGPSTRSCRAIGSDRVPGGSALPALRPGETGMQTELVSLVTFTIDDREVTAPAGTSVLEAGDQAGVHIPHLCHDPRLGPPARAGFASSRSRARTACRPPARGWSRRAWSCTPTPSVRASRKSTSNCCSASIAWPAPPATPTATACSRTTPTSTGRRDALSDVALPAGCENYASGNRAIVYDPSKCVRCQRCVRICAEVQMAEAMTLRGRAARCR